ncbi:hypothetical protein GCM10027589_12460 [Actinocorallia lasiicapitis]
MLAVSRYARTRNKSVSQARDYAALGWAVVPGVTAPVAGDRACSCDRIGCPDPGAHPVSTGWARLATTDPDLIATWWNRNPDANIILPTGRTFDVIDVPAPHGAARLAQMLRENTPVGPVAAIGDDRYLFYVATRGMPEDEDEWWSCHLDCSPESIVDNPGMRWHCRDSYVIAAPSLLPGGREVTWVRPPDGTPLPDPLRVLEILAD